MNKARMMLICMLFATMLLVACMGDDDGGDTEATATSAGEAVTTATSETADAESTPTEDATATESPATPSPEPTEVMATPTDAVATATENSGAETAEPTESAAEPTSQATIEVDAEAEAALFEIALTGEDLPEGWTQVGIMPVTEIDQGLTFCNAEPYSSPEARLAAIEAEFEIDPEVGPFLLQNLTAYPEEQATEAMEYARDVIVDCDEWTDEDGVTYQLADLDLPEYGDESFGVSLTLDVPGFGSIPADFAFVRVGGILLALGYIADEEGDIARFEPIIERAVEKMEESDFQP